LYLRNLVFQGFDYACALLIGLDDGLDEGRHFYDVDALGHTPQCISTPHA
jgi:hypothetical protein